MSTVRRQRRTTKTSHHDTADPVVEQGRGIDALLSHDRGGGALCNDPSGLCLKARGDIDASKSGVYTSIAKLAGQLSPGVDTGGGGGDEAVAGSEMPLVSVETDKATLLVKEYDGHTVVLRVPAVDKEDGKLGEIAGEDEKVEGHGEMSKLA